MGLEPACEKWKELLKEYGRRWWEVGGKATTRNLLTTKGEGQNGEEGENGGR